MVSVILIVILFFYFLLRTKREQKEHLKSWLTITDVPEEAIIAGSIMKLTEEKQRFYHDKFILLTELTLLNDSKAITARRLVPVQEHLDKPDLKIGDQVTCFGCWKDNIFYFYKFTKDKKNKPF